MDKPGNRKLTIGVVGPCGSGKSTLVAGLRTTGFFGRHIAQEHSYVPSMWKQITNPDLLIYLNASFETCTKRRNLNWTYEDYLEQLHRLSHARAHADLVIDTDSISPDQVLTKLVNFLESKS